MSSLGERKPVSMALAADASIGEMALFAKEWLSQSCTSSQQEQLLPVSPMKKSSSKSDGGLVSPEKAKEGFLLSRKNSGLEVSVEPEKGNDGLLFLGENSACGSSVEPDFQAHNLPIVDGKGEGEDGIPPLASTSSPRIKTKCSKSSSNLCRRVDGISTLTSTSSPRIKSRCLKSSSIQGRGEDGFPPLTSTSSPLIKSKSSKSSSNQGSLPGLVVAPDGVTLVKDRRKCKPRGILTVGLEMSTSSEGNDGEEEVALPIPSPSVATVEWVNESWNDILSPQSHTDELARSSSVNSKGVFGPRIALTFDFPLDRKIELGEKEASANSREAVVFPPQIGPSVQESYEVGESVEGSPGDLIVADSDISFRPESGHEVLHFGRDYSVPTSSSKQQHHVESIQVISPQKQLVFSDPDHHQSEAQSLHIHQRLQLEGQADISGSTDLQFSEGPCDYSLGMIPREHSETIHVAAEKGDYSSGMIPHEHSETIHLIAENADYSSGMMPHEHSETIHLIVENAHYSSGMIPLEHSETSHLIVEKGDYNSGMIPLEHSETSHLVLEKGDCSSGMIHHDRSETIHLTVEKDEFTERPCGCSLDRIRHDTSDTIHFTEEKAETHLGNSETESEEIEPFRPLLSVCPSLLQPPEKEGSGNADVLLGNLTDLASARDVHIITHDEGSVVRPWELSQRLHHAENQVLVAETLYQLAADNLRKTRTVVRRFNSRGEKRPLMEAAESSLSIVTLPTSRIDSPTSGEHSTLKEAVPYALSPRVPRQITSTPELTKVDLAQPLRRIILGRDSDFPQEVKPVNALIRNMYVEAEDDELNALQTTIRGVDDEAQGTVESSLALTRKAQRQYRQVSSGYNNSKSSFRKAQLHRRRPLRFSSCSKCVGLGTFLVTAAAFGFVIISLAMASCHLCYESDQYHHYLQPT